jgi:hypothetical protein
VVDSIPSLPEINTPDKMSDYEDDDMDIDGPSTKDVAFTSSTNAKGKRIVADLPVEAEDNLPWSVYLANPIYQSHKLQG